MNQTINEVTIPEVANDPAIAQATKQFLAVLNAPGGPGLETLSPEEARKVLTRKVLVFSYKI